MKKKKPEIDFLKKVVAGVLIFLMIFTSVVLYLFYKTSGMEPSVLVGAVFGATVSELGICGWIQKNKIKAGQTADKNTESEGVNEDEY